MEATAAMAAMAMAGMAATVSASAFVAPTFTMTIVGGRLAASTDTFPDWSGGLARRLIRGMYGDAGTPNQDGAAKHGNAGNPGGPAQPAMVGMDTDPAVSGATSANSPGGEITQFVFSPILATVTGGVDFTYPVYVVAEDDAGNRRPESSGPTPTRYSVANATVGSVDQSLGRVDSANATSGLAMFSKFSINNGAPISEFVASSGGISSTSSRFSVSYSPTQIRTAYGINQLSETGAGQTIAIVDAFNDPTIVADLTAFDTTYGIPAPPGFTVFNQNGNVINPTATNVPIDPSGGWESEESLDVEWAHAMAPGARIDVVETISPGLIDMLAGVTAASSLPGVSVVVDELRRTRDDRPLQHFVPGRVRRRGELC